MTSTAPDWTGLITLGVNLKAQDLAAIKTDIVAQTLAALKMDITAQTLAALKMDITAQTLAALKMDITAQTLAALKIDIITQTLSALKINITSQDLAQLVINIAAQTVGVYLQPEWAAKGGVDKNFGDYDGSLASWGSLEVLYSVTAGKTLYICGMSFSISPALVADYEHLFYGNLVLNNVTDGLGLAIIGGLGGSSIVFPKPLALSAGDQMQLLAVNKSGKTCSLGIGAWGYEV